ncbi:unnamed protein product [Oikopleura dioica]|uniref:Uncharacterized protein n=1 Tax=Oikopleura dioica TaxID=34765 RepID=E4YD81_OIKDI|nr:unnamed protein product [Oikopleura dioica]
MSSPPNSDENKELSSFYPPSGEDNNGSEQTHQDIPKHIVENEPKKGSYAPITDQPASVNIQDNGQGASEEDHLVQNQEFSSQFCECDVDCCKAYFCPCMSIFSTEKELSNEKKAKGCGALSGCLCCTTVTGELLYQIFYQEFLEIGCSCYYGYSAGFLAGIILSYVGLCGLGAVICKQRQDVKKSYGIPSNIFSDFLLSYCLPCCALVQHERQVQSGRTKIV